MVNTTSENSSVVKKVYNALLFRQRAKSPLQVAFAAPSSEIDAWARVPTKTTGNVRNFQRAEIPRHVAEVEAFFRLDANASPTAVVVGFDRIRAHDRVLIRSDGNIIATDDQITAGHPCLGTIEIHWDADADPRTNEELMSAIEGQRSHLREILRAELGEITTLSTDALDRLEAVFSGVQDRSGQQSREAGPEEEEVPDVELPEEAVELMKGLTPSEQQVVAGRLLFLGRTAPENAAAVDTETLRALYRQVYDELKPGILIDGQHRVRGTRSIDKIPFLVTALPTAQWKELAFQFIVTNRTARRVPESLLISIVGNSLSKDQRTEIDERLREAGIRVGLIEAVMRVHEDEQSPFFGNLAFGLANESGFLDAAAMRSKVIQPWFERQPPMLRLFDHFCEGRTRTDRTEFWKAEELWFDYFSEFWSAVRDRYDGSMVFSKEILDRSKKVPASKLMTATVLMIFQQTVLQHLLEYLDNKAQADQIPISQSIKDSAAFRKLVNNTLQPLTPEFFEGWGLSGFDGSKGAREDLQEGIRFVLARKKTVAELKNPKRPHRLFKEKEA